MKRKGPTCLQQLGALTCSSSTMRGRTAAEARLSPSMARLGQQPPRAGSAPPWSRATRPGARKADPQPHHHHCADPPMPLQHRPAPRVKNEVKRKEKTYIAVSLADNSKFNNNYNTFVSSLRILLQNNVMHTSLARLFVCGPT